MKQKQKERFFRKTTLRTAKPVRQQNVRAQQERKLIGCWQLSHSRAVWEPSHDAFPSRGTSSQITTARGVRAICGHPAQWEPAEMGRTAKPGKAGMPCGAPTACRNHDDSRCCGIQLPQYTPGDFRNHWADLIRFWSPT